MRVFGELVELDGASPDLADDVYVAPGAILIGNVEVGGSSSIWYGAILRGDDDRIVIGTRVNIQDGCIVHADPGLPVVLEDDVTLGHGAVVHGARIGRGSLVGIRATVLNGAQIGAGSLIAAGALVTSGTEIPRGVVAMGAPARVIRDANESDRDAMVRTPLDYTAKAVRHRKALENRQ